MRKGFCNCGIKLDKGDKGTCKFCKGYHKEPVYSGDAVIPSGWKWVKS